MQVNMRFKLRQVYIAALFGISAASPMVQAEELEVLPEYTFMDAVKGGKNLSSFRLRYETVDQDGNGQAPKNTQPLKDAEGLTLRSLVGWQTAPFHNFSFGAQLIGVTKLVDNYNDRRNNINEKGREEYPFIVDPNFTDINQLYIDWTGIKNTKFRLGRQQLNLDNVRFIGDIAYRQVMQVFDGVSVLNKSIPDTEVFLAHFEEVTQITTKQRGGDLDIANVKYRISPTEFLVGYGYLSNFTDLGFGNGWFGPAALNAPAGTTNVNADQGNKTFGLRLDGIHPFNPNLRALYTAEYAKQTDYSGGDDRIDAHYYKIGGGAGIDNFSIRADQELLSSNNGQYAFQTPFGTNHLFQGWVDKFLTTPKEGIRDNFVTATYRYGDFLFYTDFHVFDSDKDFNQVGGGKGDRYGKEWNAAVTYNYSKNIMTKIEYGKYTEDDQYRASAVANAAGRIRDTEKLWLTAMYTF
ncbi:MAG: alginate export family protein [Methylophilaceae bacterium]